MTGIFDSIIDSVSSIDSKTISKAAGMALSSYGAASQGQSPSATNATMAALNEGVQRQSYNMSASLANSGESVRSVDPESLTNLWYSRLRKFSQMDTDTAVKPR
jgi:hypothetical protein